MRESLGVELIAMPVELIAMLVAKNEEPALLLTEADAACGVSR